MFGQCGKGWGNRCPASRGSKCRCACGGANHGTFGKDPNAHDITPASVLEYRLGQDPVRKGPREEIGVITFRRPSEGEVEIKVNGQELRQRFVKHSPTGLEFGYGGSGPADTALNILALFIPPKEANRLHQRFKQYGPFSRIPYDGGDMQMPDVCAWIRAEYEREEGEELAVISGG